jgi:hypothetical protein
MKVRVGMEASGHARWFERLLSELQCESDGSTIPPTRISPEGPEGTVWNDGPDVHLLWPSYQRMPCTPVVRRGLAQRAAQG